MRPWTNALSLVMIRAIFIAVVMEWPLVARTAIPFDSDRLHQFQSFLATSNIVKEIQFRHQSFFLPNDTEREASHYRGTLEGTNYVLELLKIGASTNIAGGYIAGALGAMRWEKRSETISFASEQDNHNKTNYVFMLTRLGEQALRSALSLGIFQMQLGTVKWDRTNQTFIAQDTGGRTISGRLILSSEMVPRRIEYRVEGITNVNYTTLFEYSDHPPLGFLPNVSISQYSIPGATQLWQRTELLLLDLGTSHIPNNHFGFDRFITPGRTLVTFFSNDVHYVQVSDKGSNHVALVNQRQTGRRLNGMTWVFAFLVILPAVVFLYSHLYKTKTKEHI